MFRWLFKYGAIAFLLNTVILTIYTPLGNTIFLLIMGLYGLIFLINPKQLKLLLFHRAFLVFLLFNLINIFYFFIVHDFSDLEAIEYLLARFVQFTLIIFSVSYNYTYFKNFFTKHLTYVMITILFLSLFIENNIYSFGFTSSIFSGRWNGIVWNPNQLATFTCISFAALLLENRKKTNFDIFLLVILAISSILTGSRSVLIALPLALLLKYGISRLNIFFALFFIPVYFFISDMQLYTSINRFADQTLFSDRILQYKYAYITLMEQPFFGFGLNNYSYINDNLTPYHLQSEHIISAHNGYLAVLVQYGLIFGFLVLGIIFYNGFLLIRDYKKYPNHLFYLYMLIYTLIAALYESLFTGVNDFHTNIFWLSLCILLSLKYNINNAD